MRFSKHWIKNTVITWHSNARWANSLKTSSQKQHSIAAAVGKNYEEKQTELNKLVWLVEKHNTKRKKKHKKVIKFIIDSKFFSLNTTILLSQSFFKCSFDIYPMLESNIVQ